MTSSAVPPRQPGFVPAMGNEITSSFLLFVPPADLAILVGAKVQKFFRETLFTEGRTYLREVKGYSTSHEEWKVSTPPAVRDCKSN
jgi:hypothetical protein